MMDNCVYKIQSDVSYLIKWCGIENAYTKTGKIRAATRKIVFAQLKKLIDDLLLKKHGANHNIRYYIYDTTYYGIAYVSFSWSNCRFKNDHKFYNVYEFERCFKQDVIYDLLDDIFKSSKLLFTIV